MLHLKLGERTSTWVLKSGQNVEGIKFPSCATSIKGSDFLAKSNNNFDRNDILFCSVSSSLCKLACK
ncbi:uncharacterized protein PHALS_15111 [Plasmopara halstedii]|uniref:Uncharacterized protein n=1 Tax=Plasmopara halstedii TaxID=4781 RepID=A0A0P1AAD3_PLAHL|nr:uncharacterized protein PHALS_15111 [Plasmopara halstedii]CEG37726.1 hypothetical protein PHALS_15111 [Plasmopara halstedii]|eukprot:XP_024574095.1 hypothetical protein PHALS_15111 [Plasmopara halstedii]